MMLLYLVSGWLVFPQKHVIVPSHMDELIVTQGALRTSKVLT